MVRSRFGPTKSSLMIQETVNELQEDDAFEHISVLQEISQYVSNNPSGFSLIGLRILLPELKSLHQKIKLSDSTDGDGMNAFYSA